MGWLLALIVVTLITLSIAWRAVKALIVVAISLFVLFALGRIVLGDTAATAAAQQIGGAVRNSTDFALALWHNAAHQNR